MIDKQDIKCVDYTKLFGVVINGEDAEKCERDLCRLCD